MAGRKPTVTPSFKGETPTSRPVFLADVLATIYRHLEIDLAQQFVTDAGRPIPLLPDGTPIAELI